MSVYDRRPASDLEVVDRWPAETASSPARNSSNRAGGSSSPAGVGWLAHPAEGSRRVSHAVLSPDGTGVWVFDPLDAPGVDDLLADLGEVRGVAVLSDYHARDAGAIARRHDVPVTVPECLARVAERVDAPVERTTGPVAGFELFPIRPLFAWREAVAYREADGTLYVPDYLSSHETFCVAGERVGLPTVSRLLPPRGVFDPLEPERILFGHGAGIFEDAATALADALEGARRRFPRALVSNLPGEIRAMLGAVR